MSEKAIVSVTLEFNIWPDNINELDIHIEAMMRGAVEGTSISATGTGYNYSYNKKKSRRGMTIVRRKAE